MLIGDLTVRVHDEELDFDIRYGRATQLMPTLKTVRTSSSLLLVVTYS